MYTTGPKDFSKPQTFVINNISVPTNPAFIPSSIPQHSNSTVSHSSAPPTISQSNAPSAVSSNSSSQLRLSEVKLYSNNREREKYDHMADLYSIIRTTEALERAYVRDAISPEDYKNQCRKLISQFTAALELAKDDVPDVKKFMLDYKIDHCKAAAHRLIEEPIPRGAPIANDTSRVIAETVQYFITAMDSLKLNMTAVDQINPILVDLYDSLCKISTLAPDWEGKVKLKNWLVTMQNMKAHEELNESQVRQLLFDLENAYNRFHKSLA